jgi:hypothetical protein
MSWMGKKENIHADFVRKTEEKRAFGRTNCIWI